MIFKNADFEIDLLDVINAIGWTSIGMGIGIYLSYKSMQSLINRPVGCYSYIEINEQNRAKNKSSKKKKVESI